MLPVSYNIDFDSTTSTFFLKKYKYVEHPCKYRWPNKNGHAIEDCLRRG